MVKKESTTETTESPNDGEYVLTPEEEARYGRFSKNQKRLFMTIMAIATSLGPYSSSAYMPASQMIADEFSTTGSTVNLSGTVFNIMTAISPCLFNRLYEFYGCRPIFILMATLLLIPSILTAVSVNLPMFFVFRSLTGLFSYSFINMAASVTGHIYPPTERSTALSYCLAGTLAASAFAPVLAGVIITYASWRIIFWVQTGITAYVLAMAIVFLKETTPETEFSVWKRQTSKKFKFIAVNPFTVVLALRIPTLFLAGITTLLLSFNYFALLTPIRYVVDPRFGFTSPIQGSLFYLAPGCGMVISTQFAGRYADWVLKRAIKRRGGRLVSEDRLQACLPAMLVMFSSTIIYGWSIQEKKGGLVLPIVVMFLNGLSQTFVYTPVNSYCIGSLPEIGSPISLGSNYFIRNIGAAIGSGVTLPLFDAIGIGWSSVINGALITVAFGCTLLCYKVGQNWRTRWLKKNGYRSGDGYDREG
ncbi:hypothetical protein KL929_002676 [Ogataea haglerorum]|nr:hypothetical protein KL914_003056 [Ogataea haglerorum]KAG7708126.1 hypothetical protein KL950_002752 [Ogataea haglerorum]KAG7713121.1 hypothetical protein KL913_005348 [Ogataea haglerorum]KAG7719538.1 hypothetical protein KL949_002530 [Ogataea haglerorum]KAG7758194.1 hypothetical protein KL947_002573 [Ogataea haglerorum]